MRRLFTETNFLNKEGRAFHVTAMMKRVWRMMLEEPYRMFFPLGVLAGIWGVMLWPMLYAGWLPFYPGEAHTRMMVAGFMAAFVAGFLGTAFPRFTGNPGWSAGEFLVVLGLWAMAVVSHARNHVAAGDAAFAAMLLALAATMARRWVFGRRDTPPPGFILVFAGILGTAVAAGFLAVETSPSPAQWQWARLWLFQGFLLLPLMGIGPYLLPRFFGMPSSHSFDDSPAPPAGWWRRAVAALIAGLLVVASFALEVQGKALAGQLLRAAVIALWFALETPVLRRGKISSTPGNAVRWALGGLVAGCACAAIWPMQRVGSLHLFFVSGIGLITLTVGTRVILGHAGRHDLLAGKIIWLRWVTGLAILAATTRMSADFLPAIRVSHHIYAAWTWVIAGLIWLAALGRYLLRNEDSPQPKSRCPKRRAAATDAA
ncbi:MAG: NnrS family protein [Verrucomicrobiaceae bacterium]|nr:MAG: NnrS family protein [Verrucomicrobiaceae bacterium]